MLTVGGGVGVGVCAQPVVTPSSTAIARNFRTFFIASTLSDANDYLHSRLTRREEGEVALLETPGGLDALLHYAVFGPKVKLFKQY
jgi:hypothetical protein